MGRKPKLLDQWGHPVDRSKLTQPIQPPRVGSFQAPSGGYPADGLDPRRLATIMREADHGNALRYLELAEVIEERDPHYLGVLSTRKRSVSQIDITVKAASDDPEDMARADFIRNWLERDELQGELFNILDSLGKGYSVTEIQWAKNAGKWWPERLDYRDPKGFRYDQRDLKTLRQLTESGKEEPLTPYRFIYANIQAKSGLPLRSGLARVATWGWMFKAYTQRDWAIFTQTYGQPVRIGKWQNGASEDDKDELFKAVANIAGDCAAIIPEGMSIEFVEAKNVGTGSDLYMKRADWLDKQISKAVIGQTSTTDAVVGGLGSGKEHREVQEDIERSDAKDLTVVLNSQLIRPWMDLEYGKLERYPRVIIGKPEAEDLTVLSTSLGTLVPLGMKVSMSEVRSKYSLSEPKPGDELLGVSAQNPPQAASEPEGGEQSGSFKRFSAPFKYLEGKSGVVAPVARQNVSEGRSAPHDVEDILSDQLAEAARPGMQAMLETLERMIEASSSFDEFREMLLAGFPDIDEAELAEVIGLAMQSAFLGGMVSVAESDNG